MFTKSKASINHDGICTKTLFGCIWGKDEAVRDESSPLFYGVRYFPLTTTFQR